MGFFRRRRPYDRSGRWYDDRRDWGPPPYRRRPAGSSCVRDACLLDAGCCIGETCDDNCLWVMVLSLPHLLVASGPILRRGTGRRSVADVLVAAVRVYQREVSARRPPCCRFSPSCSAYAVEALTRHGAVRGGGLTVRRLIRCRPGGPRGHDPVPR